jgi:hypothetical protein
MPQGHENQCAQALVVVYAPCALWLGATCVFVPASAPEAAARMKASPNATLANMVSSFWLASRLMTERFSQYALRWQKSMTEPFGHNDVMGFRCQITANG